MTSQIIRLNQQRRKLTEEYEANCRAIDTEISRYKSALDTVNEAVKDIICPACAGTGEESYTDAAGSRDTRECSRCGGTGIKKIR